MTKERHGADREEWRVRAKLEPDADNAYNTRKFDPDSYKTESA